MNYIGSKLSLLDFIEQSIDQIVGEGTQYTFCDLFAGTGAVGIRFKAKGHTVIANDFQYYSYVLNRHYIGNHKAMSFSGLDPTIPNLRESVDKMQAVCDYLQNLAGVKGFIYNNYCPNGSEDERLYFTADNGQKCDAIRQKIEEWKQKEQITEDEYFFLLASLLESMDKLANTASVYGAFLKKFKQSALRPLILAPAPLYINENEHQVYNDDVNSLIKQISSDVIYLDPPYNARQYSTNYHVLETIAKYDNPELHGKTGLRDYSNQKSLYCSRSKVKTAFRELIDHADAKYIFLSYNNEGLMTLDDIKEIMSRKGRYGVFQKEHSRFKADSNRAYSANKTTEYLHYVICD